MWLEIGKLHLISNLGTKYLYLPRTSRQQDPPRSSQKDEGPFEVLKKIGSNLYHLNFAQKWNSVHPLFHVSLLETVKQSTIPNQHKFAPPLLILEEQEEWEVVQVLYLNLKKGKLWYLSERKIFSEDPKRTTWEPASNITNSTDLFKSLHTFYFEKSGPNASTI
ncbi:hypothetical protein O181_049870 [Austropuccinia psidii MF-1]|uniref:Tf2-1-like SH3-like domain-containing protein n=1 Tax=Austropuccinia psidii MF-1 TaxID=1389203 RepID=A0A9Q3E011_9BASI|nr:hypothetical protein [Austropuccinia psidii MF-1]